MKKTQEQTQPQAEKCYIRNCRFSDGEILVFHSVCDGQDYSNEASTLGKLTDAFVSAKKPDVSLIEVKDEVHFVEGGKK
jgi:hypothetical protein